MRLEVLLIRRYTLPATVAVAVVIADLLTKRWASVRFATEDLEVIPGFLGFTFTENPGAAFGLFQNAGQIMGVAAIFVTLGVIWFLRTERPLLERLAFGFIIGGAVGNLWDRVVRGDGFLDGKVIDWINLWWIPTFNLADAAVTVAVVLLLIHTWQTRETS